jgi:ribonucleoside-diphosphate reductase alpha chain
MCPNECPGLYDVHGENLKNVYYEKTGKGRKTIKAHELWEKF